MPIHKVVPGVNVPIKIWTDVVEEAAEAQLRNISSLPFVYHHVAAMPDVHLGTGATVGSVIATKGAVSPAAVGVDIGCVDCETEYLSRDGWKRIDTYGGEEIMCYDPQTGRGHFSNPVNYVKLPCERFYRIKTKYGVDQKLSGEHKILYYKYDRSYKFGKHDTITAEELADKHNSLVLGFRGRFETSFTPILDTSVDLTDDEIRIAVMVAADGHINNYDTGNCVLAFKKDRKINRAIELLDRAGIQYSYNDNFEDGRVAIRFSAPFIHSKSLNQFWEASLSQLKVIADEVIYWDGNRKDMVYYTRDKASADFVSYAFAAVGFRSTVHVDRYDDGTDYRVFAIDGSKVGINGTPKTPIDFEDSTDGYKYCFTTKTGFWVMRRNGNIVMTGNCGMIAQKTTIKADRLTGEMLKNLRHSIERAVPVGFNSHREPTEEAVQFFIRNGTPKARSFQAGNAAKQLGTLGGGNHFIEICLDADNTVWVMLHSGSRGIGNQVARVYIDQAKGLMESMFITLADPDLAYLSEGTTPFNDYLSDVGWCQDYALENREQMMNAVIRQLSYAMGLAGEVNFLDSLRVNCHHNYLALENHFGENVRVIRKGAIRARVGDMGIIPGSMGTGSYIVRGLGNPESFHSAPHGAGRKMSRTAARKAFTAEDLAAQTAGVECRKDAGVVDEIPGAYKPIETVIEQSSDLVEVVAQLKQVLCVKG